MAQEFQAIGSALQSGNISSAQNALTTFQQELQRTSQTAASQPFGQNTQANTDYQNLTSAVQSGNLATAQQSFSSLQSDLKSPASTASTQTAYKAHPHHHHGSSLAPSIASAGGGSLSSAVAGPVSSLNLTA
jgi:ribosomal protein S20